ncbi:MAG TPA: hypothetical protein DEH78_28070 [Solibacterales bacterium]|nr:hypothetical protein [Bryobacterales bacterium]
MTNSRSQSTYNDQERELTRYINLKLAALGQPTSAYTAEPYFLELAGPLLRNYHQKDLLLAERLCPVDGRIQRFLDSYLADTAPDGAPRLPSLTFTLDRPGLARVLSVPARADHFRSRYLDSYRLRQGVLHNPASDRRTTQGVFHIVEGGLPVPADKMAVPRRAFATLLRLAFEPGDELLTLPFTADQETQSRLFVSLLLRPLVAPPTGRDPRKTMEIRFFAPASLVSNLDFVESIFGNGGDPYLPENDAALDVMHWTGHTGCVILAPHLVGRKKKELGLPHWDQATERQRRDGMCWKDKNEEYNSGGAFKITCRDERGVMVTLIADNYYGYCKKEVKTQISYSANLFGMAEEEHAGGAIAYASYVLGHDYIGGRTVRMDQRPFTEAIGLLGAAAELKPEGYAVDTLYSNIFYVPGDAHFSVRDGLVRWQDGQLTLRAGDIYIQPSGYRVQLEKQPGSNRWRLIGTRPEATFCHKPSTVSGGGKSEISKSIAYAVLQGPIFVKDYDIDMAHVEEILQRDFTSAYKEPPPGDRARRPILSADRSLGSVIKLLTASADYTDEYNRWLEQLPQTIRQLVCTIKRYYRPEWGGNWREHFTVDRVNGYLGHELKYDNEKLVGNYLRIGFDPGGAWRIFKLRPDFHPAAKVQMEDDISASVVVPRETLAGLPPGDARPCVKLLLNCERMLFQRPDDVVHRGFDKQAEADLSNPGAFLSNFEPLEAAQATAIRDRLVEFDQYSDPVKHLLNGFLEQGTPRYVVAPDHPRIVDGKPTKNPRYLQLRPDLANPLDTYAAEVASRLYRGVRTGHPLHFPVDAVLAGRRGNPPDPKAGLPPLAVYNPIHYQELPELFMDLISSLTGKSPSTTGFGSEGALTKRPFNALPPVVDLNNAIVSAILTGYAGFTTAAGFVGPRFRVDHDISLLVPEIWCRMRPEERDPAYLIREGLLEKLDDFDHDGRRVLASRLGYRITALFVDRLLGRIFEAPNAVLPEEVLQPEKQDFDSYCAGIHAIVESQRRVALEYFEDGSVSAACPPLKALLHIMAHGHDEGRGVEAPEIRSLFDRQAMLASGWYRLRLDTKQERDVRLWRRHLDARRRAGLDDSDAARELERVSRPGYIDELRGTIGADPLAFDGAASS